jgi:sulfite reductase (NADPH) hemoprotein beta-component
MPQMIIANTLADGFVVFLQDDNNWTHDIAAGAVAATDEEADKLLATAKQAEQANLVLDPYLIPVELDDGIRKPTEYREYIRATGPTVPIPS